MPKLKLTKTELKNQRDALKRFQRFLPTLELKKEQLIVEIRRVEKELEELNTSEKKQQTFLDKWVALFSEMDDFTDIISLDNVETSEGNIAGVPIPVFDSVSFKENEYDFYSTPLWVDTGVETVKKLAELRVRRSISRQQIDRLERELRITIQRINLFDKVKIPECKENIRKIRIYLGDQDANAVARGKIAKAKLSDVQMENL